MGNTVEFIFDVESTYPDYLSDLEVTQCPSSPDSIPADWHFDNNPAYPVDPCTSYSGSYLYFGWAILSEHLVLPGFDPNSEDAESIVNPGIVETIYNTLKQRQRGDRTAYDKDLTLVDATTERAIYRLREGIERFLITDINNPAASALAQSTLPVEWDRVSLDVAETGFNHIPGGANILFMDGHATFIRYPGDHPVTRVYPWVVRQVYDRLGFK